MSRWCRNHAGPVAEPELLSAQTRALLAPFFSTGMFDQLPEPEDSEARAWIEAFKAAGGWFEDSHGDLALHCEKLPGMKPLPGSTELLDRVCALARAELLMPPLTRYF
jgi:hypothetical protein